MLFTVINIARLQDRGYNAWEGVHMTHIYKLVLSRDWPTTPEVMTGMSALRSALSCTSCAAHSETATMHIWAYKFFSIFVSTLGCSRLIFSTATIDSATLGHPATSWYAPIHAQSCATVPLFLLIHESLPL
jgi:hypothetical protein